jgi:NADH dehydrogenase
MSSHNQQSKSFNIMSKLVTIFGGSGFVGRYIAQRMAKEGWRVRVAVRRPNEAMFVKPYGAVGQVEPILANIRDDASVAAAVAGVDAVINCVGILSETGKNKFDIVQHEGAARVARCAAEAGAKTFVQISAIGADARSKSGYATSKGKGEAAVLEHFPGAVILRPSIIFGAEDQFFNRFATMARFLPVLPVVGPNSRFQPVYVDDVAAAAVKGALGQAKPGIYELGGPDVESFRQLMERMLKVVRRRALIVTVPFFAARIMAAGLDFLQVATFGLFTNSQITRDQVKQLAKDNVVSPDKMSFADLGIAPTDMDAILETYLWQFRPNGQYAEIMDSAKQMRDD